MRPTHTRFALSLIVFAVACGGGEAPETETPEQPGEVAARPLPEGAQAWSLLGEPLLPPELSVEARATHEANLALAEADVTASPEDADAIIWYGRRLAYLGRYREAIAVFTRGIALHPDDPPSPTRSPR